MLAAAETGLEGAPAMKVTSNAKKIAMGNLQSASFIRKVVRDAG
jgi:hypothetical protein